METINFYCIIPVYNGEKQVSSFFSTITKQTIFNQVIFIIVDDGSTDNTLSLLKNRFLGIENVKILTKENGGAGSARNFGLKFISNLEQGLVTFIDFDDEIKTNFLETLKNLILENKVDAAITSIKKCFDDSEIILVPNNISNDSTLTNIECGNLLVEEKIYPCSMGKIFKTNLWNNVFYDEFCSIGEDTPAIIEAVLNAKSILCSTYCGYYLDRKSHNESLTRGKTTNKKLLSFVHSQYVINEMLIRKQNSVTKQMLLSNARIYSENFLGIILNISKPISKQDKDELLMLKKYFRKFILKQYKPTKNKEKCKKLIYEIFGYKFYLSLGKILKK